MLTPPLLISQLSHKCECHSAASALQQAAVMPATLSDPCLGRLQVNVSAERIGGLSEEMHAATAAKEEAGAQAAAAGRRADELVRHVQVGMHGAIPHSHPSAWFDRRTGASVGAALHAVLSLLPSRQQGLQAQAREGRHSWSAAGMIAPSRREGCGAE